MATDVQSTETKTSGAHETRNYAECIGPTESQNQLRPRFELSASVRAEAPQGRTAKRVHPDILQGGS